MPSPSVDMMWQEIRVLKSRVCQLENAISANGGASGWLQFLVGDPPQYVYYSRGDLSEVSFPLDGSSLLVIKAPKVKLDSVLVFLDGSLVAKEKGDVQTYIIAYYIDRIEISRPTGSYFSNNQFYVIKWDNNG